MSLADWNTPLNRRHLARFLIIGGCCTLFDFCLYFLATQCFGVPAPLAKGLSYLSAMGPGFVANKVWAFGSKRRTLSEPTIYVALYASTLLVNVAVNSAIMALLGREIQARLAAVVIATGVTTALNFLGLRLIAFRRGIDETIAPAAVPGAAPSAPLRKAA